MELAGEGSSVNGATPSSFCLLFYFSSSFRAWRQLTGMVGTVQLPWRTTGMAQGRTWGTSGRTFYSLACQTGWGWTIIPWVANLNWGKLPSEIHTLMYYHHDNIRTRTKSRKHYLRVPYEITRGMHFNLRLFWCREWPIFPGMRNPKHSLHSAHTTFKSSLCLIYSFSSLKFI